MNNELTNIQKIKIKFISGFLGSFFSVLVCSPLDLMKVRLQVSVSNIEILTFFCQFIYFLIFLLFNIKKSTTLRNQQSMIILKECF